MIQSGGFLGRTVDPLINFETQKYYQNEPRFNGVYSRDNLPNKRRDEAYCFECTE